MASQENKRKNTHEYNQIKNSASSTAMKFTMPLSSAAYVPSVDALSSQFGSRQTHRFLDFRHALAACVLSVKSMHIKYR